MPTATVVSSVSTATVDLDDRLAFWEHYNAEALVGLTCQTYADEGLEATQLNLELDGVRVADIAGNAHLIERPPALIKSHPKEAVFVSVVLHGEGFFYHPGGCQQLKAGDVVVYGTERPYLLGFSTSMRKILLDLPRSLFELRCGATLLERPLFVSGEGDGSSATTARALRRLLSEVVDDVVASPPAVSHQLLDLVQSLTTCPVSAVGAARLLAAKSHIDERLADPSLCADTVAHAVGVTPRHLNRAFAAEGTTVTQFVQGRRLDAALNQLTATLKTDVRIADVAYHWGFASQAHFTRVFRARFGRTPSDVRAEPAPAV